MLIKEISEETGASIRSIRYYEEKGLLNPNRLGNGYREYTNQDVSIINSIQVYLQLGFKIDEISEDCTLKDPLLDSNKCITEAIHIFEVKLDEVQNQIQKLNKIENEIQEKLHQWKNRGDGING